MITFHLRGEIQATALLPKKETIIFQTYLRIFYGYMHRNILKILKVKEYKMFKINFQLYSLAHNDHVK